jgi:alpha-tubulin suppressor-like RCC1 family protein
LLGAIALIAAAPAVAHGDSASAVAFGENAHTELGAGYRSELEGAPVAVLAGEITSVAAMKWATLALLDNGQVASWGWNEKGQLGDGHEGNSSGDKLGQGTWEDHGVPYEMVSGAETPEGTMREPVLTGVKAISAHGEHALALLASGKVLAWGSNLWGQLGAGVGGFPTNTGLVQDAPKEVAAYISQVVGGRPVLRPLEDVELISSSGEDNYAVFGEGKKMVAWGGNLRGQLGIGIVGPGLPEWCEGEQGESREAEGLPGHWEPCSAYPRKVLLPAPVLDGSARITSVSSFGGAAYVLLSNGEVWSWGDNGRGQLGIPDSPVSTVSARPAPIPYFVTHPAVEVASGQFHALARLKTNTVVAWGDDEFGELGARTGRAPRECQTGVHCLIEPTPISSLSEARRLSAGYQDSFVIAADGRLYSFGKNVTGELGTGAANEAENPTPSLVSGIGASAVVSAGNAHTVVLLRPDVEPPAPLLTLTPVGTNALKLEWGSTREAGEYRARLAVFDRDSPLAPLFGEPLIMSQTINAKAWASGEITWEGLEPESHAGLDPRLYYEAKLVSPGTTRWVVAKP